MTVNLDWNRSMIKSLNAHHARTARRGVEWRHVTGNLYQSSAGEYHTCDFTCIRWVQRVDGLRICAITGLCKNSMAPTAPSHDNLKRKNDGCDGWVACPEDAIAAAEDGQARPSKKRSFRADANCSAASMMCDDDDDTEEVKREETYSSAPASSHQHLARQHPHQLVPQQMATGGWGAAVPPLQSDFDEASYGAGAFCGCSGSALKSASYACCGMHF